MVTEEDVRQAALSLAGSVERPYNRLPSFRVRSSLFLRIHELPDAFFVRPSVEERNELLGAEPGKFFITPHYEGYPGYLVRLSQVDLDETTHTTLSTHRHRDRLAAPRCLRIGHISANVEA